MLRRTLIVGALLMAAGSVFAQNLLENPGFDNTDVLAGWTCTMTHGQPSWSSHDSLGSADSGSMEHYVAATSDNQTVSCWQCVPVSELWPYVMSGWYFWPDDSDVSQIGTSRWSFGFYSDIDCTQPLGGSTTKVGFHPALETWYHLVTDEATAPAGSVSAKVFVFTWQDLANQPVRARLDDLDFSTTTLFRDGFETGDLTEWSASVP